MTTKTKYTITKGIALLLAISFSFAAIAKMSDQSTVISILNAFPLVSHISGLLSWAIPITELSLAVTLIIPRLQTAALLFSTSVLLGINVSTISFFFLQNELFSSTNQVLAKLTWFQHIVFNLLFLSLAWLARQLRKPDKIFVAAIRNSRTPV